MDTSQYLDLFLDESREHLQSINDTLLQLEETPDNLEFVQTIFRSAHTLKGMAATMGFENMATLTHHLENVLDAIRNGQASVTEELIDLCFEALDSLSLMVDSVSTESNDHHDSEPLIHRLDHFLTSGTGAKLSQVTQVKKRSKPHPNEQSPLAATYGEQVAEVIKTTLETDGLMYNVTVQIDPTCQLKGVRAFMVFQKAEELGVTIASFPSAEAIQEGHFEEQFSFILLTEEDHQEAIKERISQLLEIVSVSVHQIDQTDFEHVSVEGPHAGVNKQKADEGIPGDKQTHSPVSPNRLIRVNLDRLDALMNLFEELVIERGRLEGLSKQLKNSELTDSVERLLRTSSSLQDVILNLRMVPIEQVFNRFPRMVRTVAKDLSKEIKLVMSGQETEIDRIVLDEIGDPLVHLLRNSMDHGIESPEKRRATNKPEEGTIQLRAYHQGTHIFIEIEDDGGGIQRENVLKKAISNGLMTKEEAEKLEDQDVYSLLFHSGFSTAEKVSDLSGRGVGLDVVKNKIESLGGQVDVMSTPGKGSLFSIRLPMTLSIISAMLFKVSDETFAMPLASLLETQLVEQSAILKVQGTDMLQYRDRVIPLIHLNQDLGLPSKTVKERTSVLIVQKGSQLVALSVDRLIGQQEIVIKPLGDYFKFGSGFSGATILGDGSVSLILDPMFYFN